MTLARLPKYKCEKHGEHELYIISRAKGFEGVWCMICGLEKLDELGVKRMEEVKEVDV